LCKLDFEGRQHENDHLLIVRWTTIEKRLTAHIMGMDLKPCTTAHKIGGTPDGYPLSQVIAPLTPSDETGYPDDNVA
jgi:hypothetical protein